MLQSAKVDITQIKTFLEVYRTRHFGRAAANLFVTQSAVSARIRQLEDKLGTRLFTRDRNDIKPTPAGQKLFRHAESIMMSWNRVRLEIAVEDESRIPVVVGGVPGLWDIYLHKWIKKAHHEFPDIVFTCETVSPENLHNRLLEGTVDIGFAYEPPQHPDLVADRKININLVMVSSGRNLTAEEATRNDYVYVDWGTAFAVSHAGHFPDIPVPVMRTGMGDIARRFLLESGGSAYLPDVTVRQDQRQALLHRVKGAPKIVLEACAVYRNGNESVKFINRLLQLA